MMELFIFFFNFGGHSTWALPLKPPLALPISNYTLHDGVCLKIGVVLFVTPRANN